MAFFPNLWWKGDSYIETNGAYVESTSIGPELMRIWPTRRKAGWRISDVIPLNLSRAQPRDQPTATVADIDEYHQSTSYLRQSVD